MNQEVKRKLVNFETLTWTELKHVAKCHKILIVGGKKKIIQQLTKKFPN